MVSFISSNHSSYGHCNSTYVIESSFSLTSIIVNMKHIYKKVFKSKKASLGSIHGREPVTSTSAIITSANDLLPSTPTYDATASAQVTAGDSVSVQLRPSHL
jgi:hypothetical protein